MADPKPQPPSSPSPTSHPSDSWDARLAAAAQGFTGVPPPRPKPATMPNGKPVVIEHKKESFFNRFSSIPQTQRIFFTQNLEVMVRTGFSLGVALRTLALQTEHKRFKAVITEIKEEVESGVNLSTALAAHPRVFSELFVNMIAAGEASGKLDEVLKRLTEQMKKDARLRGKVKGALTYPTIVVIAMIGVGTAMLTFVIPKITAVFAEAGGTLPLPTRVLIGASNLLVHHGIIIGIGVVVAIVGLSRALRTPKGKRAFDQLMLRLPIVAPIVRKVNIAQITRTLSSLLATDIPIVQTFQIISKTLSNQLYKESMLEAAESVKKGVAVVKALEVHPKLFPPIVTQMVAIGEESGTLDSVSNEIANFYEEEVDQTMSNLSTILEPVLMLMLGAGVAGIALAVLLPIYGLSNQIQ